MQDLVPCQELIHKQKPKSQCDFLTVRINTTEHQNKSCRLQVALVLSGSAEEKTRRKMQNSKALCRRRLTGDFYVALLFILFPNNCSRRRSAIHQRCSRVNHHEQLRQWALSPHNSLALSASCHVHALSRPGCLSGGKHVHANLPGVQPPFAASMAAGG